MSSLHTPQHVVAPVQVTPDNFNRAESDINFSGIVKDGALGKLLHNRELMTIDCPIVRPNRDTLYSMGIFDLDAGPVTISLPDPGKRFMSLQVTDEDQYCPAVVYTSGRHTFRKEDIGTRYIAVGIRILVDPTNPEDLKQVHALQDAIALEPRINDQFEIPDYDEASRNKVRNALLALAETIPDTKQMFGPKDTVDPVRHLIGTAMGFGGNPEKDALYLTVTPDRNDGATIHRLSVKDVPVDGFWSISVYNAEGRFEKNPQNAYSLNNLTAAKDADGAVTVQFGGCTGKTANCLPIVKGWNYTVRLYRPRSEILNGSWRFPEAEPVN